MSHFGKRNFRDSEIKELIRQYKQHDCLWNIHSPDYKNMSLKRQSWAEIADYFQKDISEVKLKVQYLRTAYVHSKRKVDASRKSGSDSPYKPSLFYYNELNFLDSMVIWRKFKNGIQPTDECFKSDSTSQDAEDEEFLTIDKEEDEHCHNEPEIDYKIETFSETDTNLSPLQNPISSSIKMSRSRSFASRPEKSKMYEDYNLNRSVPINDPLISSTVNPQTKHLFISFGKTIALQLQQLPLEQAVLAMSEIHTIITKATLEHIKSWSQSESKHNYGEPTEDINR